MALRSAAATLSVSLIALASSGALANMAVQPVPQQYGGRGHPASGPDISDTAMHHFTVFLRSRSAADAKTVAAYFQGFGFVTTYHQASNTIGVNGTYAQAQAAGHFAYRTVGKGDAAFPLPDRRLSFAPSVKDLISHTTFYIGPKMMPQTQRVVDQPDDTATLLTKTGFGPGEYAKFYNINPVYAQDIKGQNQIVDIFSCGGVNPADIDYFSRQYGLPYAAPGNPAPTVTQIDLEPNPFETYYGLEPTLDVERIHGTAPQASIRLFYVSPANCGVASFEDAFAAIEDDQASNPADALNISYGISEDALDFICQYYGANYCSYASTMSAEIAAIASTGVTIFASSGDQGGFWIKSNYYSAFLGDPAVWHTDVSYPASDPNVIAVGGTTIRVDQAGELTKEWAWSGHDVTGSGGGVSIFFTAPSWQQSALGLKSTDPKQVPDVANLADPYTGAAVAYCVQGGCNYATPVFALGGTSASSPTMAGVLALIDSARAKNGKSRLANVGSAFYTHQKDFRDITVGDNGPYAAGPGYDNVTGIGTPNVAKLVRDLE